MHEERITLGAREQRRALVLTRVVAGAWTSAQAALALRLSERQVRRLVAAYRVGGPAALVHGNRGRAPANRLPAPLRAQIVALAQGTYAGFNHQHLTEELAEVERLRVGRPTVRRVLLGAGLGSPRARRPPKHRKRRERAAREGLLLQAGGSRHRWLGPDGPWLTLVGGIDDATGTVPSALFRTQEDAQGYLLWLRAVATSKGLPQALSVDRHGIFRRQQHEPLTLDEELAGGPLPPQVGRALAELGVRPIHALSPQAKGRVERLWGTFQDRLCRCSEPRLAGARPLADANRVLWAFLPRFNARFGVPAAEPGSAYRPLPPDLDLAHVFCFRSQRVVATDTSVRLGPHRLQLLPGPDRRTSARVAVEIHEGLDGSLAVSHRGRCLATRAAPPEAPVLRVRGGRPGARAATGPTEPTAPPEPVPEASTSYVPPPPHPWKQKRFTEIRPLHQDRSTWR